MTKYVASISIPGYLPEGDTPVFDTAAEAWGYLADERREAEEAAYELSDPEDYSQAASDLDAHAQAAAGSEVFTVGTVYADRPGYEGDHDLGLAYAVNIVSDADAAEIEALQGY